MAFYITPDFEVVTAEEYAKSNCGTAVVQLLRTRTYDTREEARQTAMVTLLRLVLHAQRDVVRYSNQYFKLRDEKDNL